METIALPCLGRRVVHFEDSDAIARVRAIRERIESRAEHHHLSDAAFHGGSQGVLRETRSHGDEDSHARAGGSLFGPLSDGLGVHPQDTQRQRIGKDAPLFQYLVRGAMKRRCPRCPAWCALLHYPLLINSVPEKWPSSELRFFSMVNRSLHRIFFVSALLLGTGVPALHGQAGLDKDFKKDWQTSKEFTLAVANAMPAEKYGFKVSPEEMPFAALMLHIATAQAYRFAQVSGKPMPFEMPTTIPKDSAKEFVMKLLAQSFDFCIAQLDTVTPEQLSKLYKVDWYERPEVSGSEILRGMFTHTAHHRGQAEVYLRANGITPPPYRF